MMASRLKFSLDSGSSVSTDLFYKADDEAQSEIGLKNAIVELIAITSRIKDNLTATAVTGVEAHLYDGKYMRVFRKKNVTLNLEMINERIGFTPKEEEPNELEDTTSQEPTDTN